MDESATLGEQSRILMRLTFEGDKFAEPGLLLQAGVIRQLIRNLAPPADVHRAG